MLFQVGGGGTQPAGVAATEEQNPHQKEAAARAQQFTLNQRIDVNNAPAGTEIESKTTAAPQLSFAGVGANVKFNQS